MGDPMVSSSTGAMNSLLLHKLRVVEEQYPELAQGLRESLKSLSDVLHSFARQRASLNDSLVNQWMLQVRELVYDMEDWIDGDPSNSKPNLDDVEEQIQEFKAQIQGALDRCTRYDLLSSTNTVPATTSTSNCAAVGVVQDDDAETSRESSVVAMDPKLLHGEAPCRLMAGPMNVLVNHLMDQQERRKVVCILGTGGIGKSTLATRIYRQLQGHFSCGAFVHLGRNPSVKTTLITILKQVMPDWHCQEYLWNGYNSEDIEAWDEKKVITKLWAFLKTKSYFVVLVDMRSISNWKKISCALPNKHKSSDRILITTCTKDVAESCCIHPTDFVHPMDRLSDKDSKTLFQSKVPDSEQHRLLDQVSDDMLEMCGRGVPLAITITAALLSRKSACFPRPDQCRSTPQSQWMRKVLEISYDDLPLPLKSCFLYLTAFSANHTIKKDRLIRRWEAEGLIAKRDGESLWETGESYFNELINRRLIQPEFDDDNDEPTGCTVHGVVLDFMESLSAEENFTTQGAKLKCGLFPYERVRRIFLDCGEEEEGDALFCSKYYCSLEQKSREEDSSSEESSVCDQDEAISLHLSQVRSLAFCGDVGRIPDLSDFKLVRVLDLSDVKGLQNQQLESIARLSLLRYLALGGADVTELPQEIMELDHLSSLDLRQTEVKKLPEFKGTKLACLLANGLTIPGGGGMGEMEELEELSTVCVGRDGSLADNVAGLVNQLMRLRMLGVRFRITYNNTAEEAERQGIKHLMEEVGKSNLQLLFLDEYPHRLLDLLVDCWSHVRPRYLRKFELRLDWLLCPVKVPQVITFLVDLTHLHIGVSIVDDAEGVRALGGLPKLVLLKLHSLRPQHGLTGESQSPARLSVSSKDGFQRLKVLWYVCEHGAWTGLQFEEGAMPQLRRLFIDFQSSEEDTDDFVLGIQHFSCLVQVRATIYYEPKPTTSTQVSAAEKHIREQVSQNPNNPVLEFNRKRKGCLVRRLGPPSNEKPSAVIKIHSLDEWTIMTELEAKNKLVVVEFTASWCGPSRSIAPFFAYLANKFPDAIFLKVDIDDMKYIAEAYEVSGAPIFLFMNKGEVKDRLSGAHKEELLEKIQLQMMALLVDN